MNFVEHVKSIDRRLEIRRENEYQMTMFGQEGVDIGGIGFSNNNMSSRPNVFGGQDIMQNGVRVGYTQPNVFGGQDIMQNGARVGYTQPNVFGGYDYRF